MHSPMPDKPPLSDEAVHALLQDAIYTFQFRDCASQRGRDVLRMAVRDLTLIQMGLLVLMDEANPPHEPEPPDNSQ